MLALVPDFYSFFSQRNSLEMFKTNWNDNFYDMNEKYFSKNKENGRMNDMKVVRQASLLVRNIHIIKVPTRKPLTSNILTFSWEEMHLKIYSIANTINMNPNWNPEAFHFTKKEFERPIGVWRGIPFVNLQIMKIFVFAFILTISMHILNLNKCKQKLEKEKRKFNVNINCMLNDKVQFKLKQLLYFMKCPKPENIGSI